MTVMSVSNKVTQNVFQGIFMFIVHLRDVIANKQ